MMQSARTTSMSFLRLSRILRNTTGVRNDTAGGIRNILLLTLTGPSEAHFIRQPVDSVTLPGVEGVLTVTNNHRQSVTQLKPGVVTVRQPAQEPKTFFMTNGFLFFKSPTDDSGCCTAEVTAIEIVPNDALCKERATQVLNDILKEPKETEWDKARALLAQEMLSCVIRASS